MKELITPPVAAEVPALEIARWIVRLNRVEFALTELDASAPKDEYAGYETYLLIQSGETGEDWRADPRHEFGMIDQLKNHLTPDGVTTATSSKSVSAMLLRDGFEKIGVFEGDATEPVIGALAALCVKRADINEAVDRTLFDRKPEIDTLVTEIEGKSQPIMFPERTTPLGRTLRDSVYNIIYLPKDEESLGRLGLKTEEERLHPWWPLLLQDLVRINEAAAGLQ
jgi:hypothetical protein